MARRAITMTELLETVFHWHKGESLSEISRSLGLSRNTVKKYVRLVKGAGLERGKPLPGEEELAGILKGREAGGWIPNREAPVRSYLALRDGEISKWLEDKEMTAKQVWRLLVEGAGQRVGYTSVKRYVRERHGLGRKQVFCRIETEAGKEAQVDFGYAGMVYDPDRGRERKVYAFVMVLSYSRHRFVRLVFGQDKGTWIECHRLAFEFFGGVPERVVLDNLKSGVVKADVYDPTLNREYGECERHYGFLADPAKARTPRHKGKVERLIRVVRQQVMAGRKFRDLQEANERALIWCREEVGREIHGTIQRRPVEVFESEERGLLRALPEEGFECPVWKECTVHADQHIFFQKSFYSLPERFVGRKVWVRGERRLIRIYFQDKLVKTHVPAPHPGFRRTDPLDIDSRKLAYVMPEPGKCLEEAGGLGESVRRLVEKVLERPGWTSLRKVQAVLRLGSKYGGRRLEGACQRALCFGNLSLKGLKGILEGGLEDLPEAAVVEGVVMSEQGRSFLRPGSYYGQEVWS